MTSSPLRWLIAPAAAILLAGPVFAQSSAPLPSMPLPPSASDPAPKETAKPKGQSSRKAKKTTEETADAGTTRPLAKPKRSTSSSSSSGSYERPTRYVPEEFDQGSGGGGSRVRPFMGEGGRAGMGMQF